EAAQLIGVDREAEIDERLPGGRELDLRFVEGSLCFHDAALGHAGGILQPGEGAGLELHLQERTQELGLALSYLGGIDEREYLARLHPVAELLLDAPDAAGQTRGKTGNARGVVGDLPRRADRLADGADGHRSDADAGFPKRLRGGELQTPQVQPALAAVLGPLAEAQGRLDTGEQLRRDDRRRRQLRDLGVAQGTLVDTVLAAPAEGRA